MQVDKPYIMLWFINTLVNRIVIMG